nr:serine/threonine-protein kinase BRI1-like 2 [Ipomoea trifida]
MYRSTQRGICLVYKTIGLSLSRSKSSAEDPERNKDCCSLPPNSAQLSELETAEPELDLLLVSSSKPLRTLFSIICGIRHRVVNMFPGLTVRVVNIEHHLDMSFNNLTNSISKMRIEVCDSLSFLDLSENRFTDSVLSWWRLGIVLVSPR